MEFLACGSFADFAQSDNFVAVIAITLGSIMGLTGIIGGTIGGVMKTRAKEMTKCSCQSRTGSATIETMWKPA